MKLASLKRIWPALLILTITLSAFALGFTLARSQPTPEESYQRLASEIMGELSKLRGLNPPESFQVRVVSSAWVKEQWGKPKALEEPLEWKIYKAVLLVPREASYADFEKEWAGCILAASSGETLYIVSDMVEGVSEKALKRTLAHESTHILQYVNFKVEWPKVYDGRQALSALVEGDADLSADMLLEAEGFKPPERQAYKPERLGYREALTLLKLFPYQYGEAFAAYLHEKGGWKLLDKAYARPPTTTEQILHPEKYLQGEGFEKPELPRVEGEWELQGEERLGEYFIYVWLAKWVGYGEAWRAAEGWNGDRAAYYKADEDFLLIWATRWDSKTDAEEFLKAVGEMLSRAGGVKVNSLWKIEQTYVAVEAWGEAVNLYFSSSPKALGKTIYPRTP